GARTGSALGAGAQQTGANISNLLAAQGQQAGAAQLGQANVLGGTIQQLAGLAGQSGVFSPQAAQPQLTTAQQFGTVPGSQQTQLLAAQQAGF
ncbi:MAG: hypothetical protein V3T88_06030, partial [Nitrosomonadaceae bacterium]